jgi:hypothetical protein
MEKVVKQSNIPKWAKAVLITTFIFYLWFLVSTLLLPLEEFLNMPDAIYLTFYKIVEFPPAILGFMICVSLISTIIVILEFQEQKGIVKIFLTESMSFMLYFIIPILATIFLIALLALRITGQIPSEVRISYFLEDLFLFTSALFLMTAVLNIATQKIIAINTKKK